MTLVSCPAVSSPMAPGEGTGPWAGVGETRQKARIAGRPQSARGWVTGSTTSKAGSGKKAGQRVAGSTQQAVKARRRRNGTDDVCLYAGEGAETAPGNGGSEEQILGHRSIAPPEDSLTAHARKLRGEARGRTGRWGDGGNAERNASCRKSIPALEELCSMFNTELARARV